VAETPDRCNSGSRLRADCCHPRDGREVDRLFYDRFAIPLAVPRLYSGSIGVKR
jgi:hypothetical protein